MGNCTAKMLIHVFQRALFSHVPQVKEWRTIISLGRAPGLVYLTMFSNPISKIKMYRTFMVNCCGSLRGLDLYAVSDEEVIEGARFFRGSRYCTCSPALALPQLLFTGLIDFFLLRRQQDQHAETGSATVSLSTCADALENLPSGCCPSEDEALLASVVRRVGLLRRFHAKQSPVVIGQRQFRRFIQYKASVAAVVTIQACARRWCVAQRAKDQLKGLLRKTGELYLVEV